MKAEEVSYHGDNVMVIFDYLQEKTKQTGSPRKKKGEEEKKEVWKWWEEAPRQDGVKWTTLEHKGPYFAPLYEHLPDDVPFIYDGKPYKLSEAAEEVDTSHVHDTLTPYVLLIRWLLSLLRCLIMIILKKIFL